ncbi:hypothetical protein C8R46DRAFT_905670, partial [Mycena filopes]
HLGPPPSPILSAEEDRKRSRAEYELASDSNADEPPAVRARLLTPLDALPPHLMTPFNGPNPPSNLDKIARGVTQAKGEDWPHSLRATRVKLIELARAIAEEDKKPRKSIPEETDIDYSDYPAGDVLQQTTNLGTTGVGIGIGLGPRRPLYRQSSMDFLNTSDPQDNETITRSVRSPLDHFPNTHLLLPPFHPEHVHPSIPRVASNCRLNPRLLRRSASITSSSSTTSNSRMSLSSTGGLLPIAADPRVQRVRRSESLCGPAPNSRQAVERAPSYGALAHESRDKTPVDIGGPYPSSDEEEKMRTRRAKKPRMRSETMGTYSPPLSPSPAPSPPLSASRSPVTLKATAEPGPPKRTTKSKASVNAAETQTVASPPKAGHERPKGMNVKRNPSMFGAELPRLPSTEEQLDARDRAAGVRASMPAPWMRRGLVVYVSVAFDVVAWAPGEEEAQPEQRDGADRAGL